MKPRMRNKDPLAVSVSNQRAGSHTQASPHRATGIGAKSRTILVPIDLPECSGTALSYAYLMAERMNASVLVLHVIERPYAGGFRDSWASERSSIAVRRETLRKLSRSAVLANLKGKAGIPLKCLVAEGNPQHEIVRLAQSRKISLIILERHSRGPLSRLFFGSTTGSVVDYAPCPVVVVPENAQRLEEW